MKITIKSNAGGSFTVDPKTGEREHAGSSEGRAPQTAYKSRTEEREEDDCAGSGSLSSAGAELPDERVRN